MSRPDVRYVAGLHQPECLELLCRNSLRDCATQGAAHDSGKVVVLRHRTRSSRRLVCRVGRIPRFASNAAAVHQGEVVPNFMCQDLSTPHLSPQA